MHQSARRLLQVVIILLGIATLTFLVWEPTVEGVNVNATLPQIYFHDPFLAYVYIGSIPFFVALYHAFILFGSTGAVHAQRSLRTIRTCAFTLMVFIIGAELYLSLVRRGEDDIAGGVAMGLFALCVSIAIAIAATVAERRVNLTASVL